MLGLAVETQLMVLFHQRERGTCYSPCRASDQATQRWPEPGRVTIACSYVFTQLCGSDASCCVGQRGHGEGWLGRHERARGAAGMCSADGEPGGNEQSHCRGRGAINRLACAHFNRQHPHTPTARRSLYNCQPATVLAMYQREWLRLKRPAREPPGAPAACTRRSLCASASLPAPLTIRGASAVETKSERAPARSFVDDSRACDG